MLAALPIGGFARHVYVQLEELRELNLRSLGKAAEDIAELMLNAETVVSSLEDEQAFACELDARQLFLKLMDSADYCDTKRLQKAANSNEDKPGSEQDSTSKQISVSSNSLLASAKKPACADESNCVEKPSIEQKPAFFSFSSNQYKFEVQLNEMLAILPAGDEIDLLLIVENDLNVVASFKQRTDLGISINSLDALRNPAGDSLKDLKLSATLVERIVLSGMSFDLLCQPIRIGSGTYANHQLAVCGLVDSSRLKSQALTVTPLLVVVLLVVVIFGVLCWPLLKVVLMSNRERFKFSDLYFLLFGAWGAVMIAVILVLGFQTHLDLSNKIETSNRKIADDINDRLSQELWGLYGQLLSLDNQVTGPSQCAELHKAEPHWQPTVMSDFEMVFWVYPDETGQQFRKATALRKNTPLVKLANREYFKRARDDKLWRVGEHEYRWYVENVRSKTTTAVRTMLSTVSSHCVVYSTEEDTNSESGSEACSAPNYELVKCEEEASKRAVVAVQARLISVADPVLSPGVGFAVIDDNGYAIFHSDHRRVLKDNFFDEMSNGNRLRAAVLARTGLDMESSYLGRPHQIYVRPVGELPWSIVVFSDNEPKRAVILEVVAHAVLLAFIFLVINLVGTLLYLSWAGQELPRWFWPTPGSTSFHARWSLGLAVTFILFVGSLAFVNADIALILCIAVPALILVAILITSRRRPYAQIRSAKKTGRRAKISARSWYVVASGLLWLNVAVVPAHVFYLNALASAMMEFVKQENVIYGADLEARQCSMADYYSRIPKACEKGKECDCRRDKACRNDIYRSALYDSNQELFGESSSGPDKGSFAWRWFARFKPVYSESIVYRRYLSHQDGGPWSVNADGELTYQHPHPACAKTKDITSIIPNVGASLSDVAVILSGITLFILGLAWLRHVANKLYLYEIEQRSSLGHNDVMGRDSHVVAFIASKDDRERLKKVNESRLFVYELEGPINNASFKLLQSLKDDNDQLLVLSNFDSRSLNCRVPHGMVIKWFAQGEEIEGLSTETIGGDFWRRHLNRPIDEAWVYDELASSIGLLKPEVSVMLDQARSVGMTKREALLLLSETMHDYYKTLWQQCSKEERLVLVQLIEEAVVNPKQAHIVRSLLRRGLIKRDPGLRTMNDSFARWIADTYSPEDIGTWEESADGATWSQLRWVFVSVLVLIFAFLWFTQRHVVESGLTFLSVAGIAIPSLLKLASSIKVLGGQADT
jgi:hypothetical protein